MPMSSCAAGIPSFADGFDFCAPNVVFGEIEQVIVSPLETETGNPYPNDWTSEADWDDLLTAPTGTDPVAYLIPVRGTLDEPDRPEIEASMYRKFYPPKRFNLPANVDDLSDVVYDACRDMVNNSVRLWYISGGYIFGGPQGIVVDVDSWPVIEEGEDSMHRYHLHFSWRARRAPQRALSPFSPVEATPTV